MNVTAMTDTSGSVIERYAYDPYGKVTMYNSACSDTVRTGAKGPDPLPYSDVPEMNMKCGKIATT